LCQAFRGLKPLGYRVVARSGPTGRPFSVRRLTKKARYGRAPPTAEQLRVQLGSIEERSLRYVGPGVPNIARKREAGATPVEDDKRFGYV